MSDQRRLEASLDVKVTSESHQSMADFLKKVQEAEASARRMRGRLGPASPASAYRPRGRTSLGRLLAGASLAGASSSAAGDGARAGAGAVFNVGTSYLFSTHAAGLMEVRARAARTYPVSLPAPRATTATAA